jgi:hypothetical protein
MSTLGAAASIEGAYMCMRLYTHIMLYYTKGGLYTVNIHYICISIKKVFFRNTIPTISLSSALDNIAQNFLHIHIYIYF